MKALPDRVVDEIEAVLGRVVESWGQGSAAIEGAVCEARCVLQKLVVVKMLDSIYTPDEIGAWLAAPQELLDGDVPNDLIRAGGAQRVFQCIKGLLYKANELGIDRTSLPTSSRISPCCM